MINDLNLNLLSGGFYYCDPLWSSEITGRDRCYKIYIPVNGEACVVMGGKKHSLVPGNVYFLNGFNLDRQYCSSFMEIYWIHFVPESILLKYFLNKFPGFYSWNLEESHIKESDYSIIPKLFDNPFSQKNNFSANASLGLTCKVISIIFFLISDIMDKQSVEINEQSFKIYLKLKPAIEFINNNFNKNISLKEMAKQINLNHIYFHRLFKSNFKISPLEYLLEKKLNTARRYLTETGLSIQEISDELGFCNQFYFSKMFKKHFDMSPSKYRTYEVVP